MKFSSTLIHGQLIQRYKRFFADVEYTVSGQLFQATVHVPNTGSLKSVIEKKPSVKQNCLFSLHNDPAKKLKGTLEAVQTIDGSWVGVNTSNPNRIVTEAIQAGFESKKSFLKHWGDYTYYKPEYKISKETRLDGVFCYKQSDLDLDSVKKHFIEIKNTTYKEIIGDRSIAQFPDAVTERGQKHLIEMIDLMRQGHKCELIFTVQRQDVQFFSASKIDPDYAKLLKSAFERGLIITPLLVNINENHVVLTQQTLEVLWF
ncbi:MAG: DNA/RNA nuclease SfsA [Pseudobdellovibrio sp.]